MVIRSSLHRRSGARTVSLCGGSLIETVNVKVGTVSAEIPFGRLWYREPNAIDYAKFRSRSHDAVIRVYDEAGNVCLTKIRLRKMKAKLLLSFTLVLIAAGLFGMGSQAYLYTLAEDLVDK
jgi:hypothetical protein